MVLKRLCPETLKMRTCNFLRGAGRGQGRRGRGRGGVGESAFAFGVTKFRKLVAAKQSFPPNSPPKLRRMSPCLQVAVFYLHKLVQLAYLHCLCCCYCC